MDLTRRAFRRCLTTSSRTSLLGPLVSLSSMFDLVKLFVLLADTFFRFITRTGRETAEDATQIFGGRGITTGGMGKLIENVSLGRTSYSLLSSN